MLIAFYRNKAPDSEGRMLDEILSWDNSKLESVHDFIQWLFPLKEPSSANPDAPILSEVEIATMKEDPLTQKNLIRSFERMMEFYGFGEISSKKHWLTPHNHNFLRITRILKSLCILGQKEKAKSFFQWLKELYHAGNENTIGPVTFQYWNKVFND